MYFVNHVLVLNITIRVYEMRDTTHKLIDCIYQHIVINLGLSNKRQIETAPALSPAKVTTSTTATAPLTKSMILTA